MSENTRKWKTVLVDERVPFITKKDRLTLCIAFPKDPIGIRHYSFETTGKSLCGCDIRDDSLSGMEPVSWNNIKGRYELASCANCRRILWDMILPDVIYPDKDSVLVVDAVDLSLFYPGGAK